MERGPRKPSCAGCPHDFRYSDPIPMHRNGVMMHLGERFCLGGRKTRRFRRRDPSVYVPDWCPRRKDPCTLRVYGFKSFREEWLHCELCRSTGKELSPTEHHYALILETSAKLSPRDFWKRCETMPEPEEGILEKSMERYQILEIDDGLRPVFFYKTAQGFKTLCMFHAEIARKNRLED